MGNDDSHLAHHQINIPCFACGDLMTGATSMMQDDQRGPRENDVTVCGKCGTPQRFVGTDPATMHTEEVDFTKIDGRTAVKVGLIMKMVQKSWLSAVLIVSGKKDRPTQNGHGTLH